MFLGTVSSTTFFTDEQFIAVVSIYSKLHNIVDGGDVSYVIYSC